jgi:hypothetical protein
MFTLDERGWGRSTPALVIDMGSGERIVFPHATPSTNVVSVSALSRYAADRLRCGGITGL